MGRANSLKKTLMLGKTEDKRRRQRRMRWLASLTQWTWVQEIVKDKKPGTLQSMGSQSQTWLSCWTTTAKKENSQEIQHSLWKCAKLFFKLWEVPLSIQVSLTNMIKLDKKCIVFWGFSKEAQHSLSNSTQLLDTDPLMAWMFLKLYSFKKKGVLH